MSCAVAACPRSAKARGWCSRHYQRWKRHGDPEVSLIAEYERDSAGLCIADACDKTSVAHGLCAAHYQRLRRSGEIRQTVPLRIVGDPAGSFWQKVEVSDDCWTWTGSTNNKGYGQLSDGSRLVNAHRFAYELLVGPIPDGLEIDHLCRIRNCVNPDHLEPVTHAENVRRAKKGDPKFLNW